MMMAAGRTIGQVAEDLVAKYDMAPGPAMEAASGALKLVAEFDRTEADDMRVTADQEDAIGRMVWANDQARWGQEGFVDDRLRFLRRDNADKEEIVGDSELADAMMKAAVAGTSVGDLAEMTGLSRDDVLKMLGEEQA